MPVAVAVAVVNIATIIDLCRDTDAAAVCVDVVFDYRLLTMDMDVTMAYHGYELRSVGSDCC